MSAAQPARLRLPLTQPQAVGATTVLEWRPEPGGAARHGLVLGHSAGTQVTHPLLGRAAAGLAERGWPVLGFNFAYSEAGRRGPDPPRRLEAAFHDAARARPPKAWPGPAGEREGRRSLLTTAAHVPSLPFLSDPVRSTPLRSCPFRSHRASVAERGSSWYRRQAWVREMAVSGQLPPQDRGRPFLFSSEDWTAWKAAHTLHLEEMQTVSA